LDKILGTKKSLSKRGYNDYCSRSGCNPPGGECFDQEITPECGIEGTNITCFDLLYQCQQEHYDCDCYEDIIGCFESSTNETCREWGYYFYTTCREDCNQNDYGCGPTPNPIPTILECSFGNCEGGMCPYLLSNGSSCYWNYQCESGECSEGECQKVVPPPLQQYPGDPCSVNTDCIYQKCSGGICQGVSKGQPCNSSNECNFGLFCNENGDCAPRIPNGHPCNYTTACGFISNCVTVNETSTCVAEFSGTAGSSCANYQYCVMGLLCLEGVCTEPSSTSVLSCQYDSDCVAWGSESECLCDANIGESFCGYEEVYPALCNSFWNSLISCISNHGCVNSDISDPNSCSYKFCRAEVGCIFSCLYESYLIPEAFSCIVGKNTDIDFSCPSLTLGTTGTTATTAVSTGSTGTTNLPTTATTGSHTGGKLTTTGSTTGSTTGGTSPKTSSVSLGDKKSASFLLIPLILAIVFYL